MTLPSTNDTKAGRAVRLLTRVLATGWFDHEALANELVVTTAALESYVDGRAPMPLDRQMCLATFVIAKLPPLARDGHRLRGQVQAAVAFHTNVTETHLGPPPGVWP